MKKLHFDASVQPCPFCGHESVTFLMRKQACSIWKYPNCPECGVTLKMNRKFLIKRFIALIVAIILFVVLTMVTDAYKIPFWSMLLILAESIISTFGAGFADLDYEETWKYPKPPPENYGSDD